MTDAAHRRVRRRHRRRRHRAQRGLPPGGVRGAGRGARRDGRVRVRLDLQGGRRGAGAVLRRGQHRARAAQPADLRDVRARSSGRRSTCTRSATCSCSTPRATSRGSRRDVALQNELGVPSRMLEVAEAKRLSPLIDTDGLLAAAYSPTDGHCTPESVVLGYAGAARRAGATPAAAAPTVEGIEHDGGTHHRGPHRRGARSAPTPSSARPAPWSAAVGAMAGVDLPVTAGAPGDRRDRAGPGARPADAVHDRLRHHLLLPRRGARGCSWACPTRSCSPRPSSGGRRPR